MLLPETTGVLPARRERRRRCRSRISIALLFAVACSVGLFGRPSRKSLTRMAREAVAGVYYGLDPRMLGRNDAMDPSPRCCAGPACLRGGGAVSYHGSSGGSTAATAAMPGGGRGGRGLREATPELPLPPARRDGRTQGAREGALSWGGLGGAPPPGGDRRGLDVPSGAAPGESEGRRGGARPPARGATPWAGAAGQRVTALTYVRSRDYLGLARQLECTLARSNPGLELAAMVVRDELGDEGLAELETLVDRVIEVEPLDFPNRYEAKYGRNWLKLRAWGLTQYDAILLLDADTAVIGDVSHLWGLPTDFAAVWDQSRWLSRHKTRLESINGGFLFLRPCAAVADHMISLVTSRPKLRFTHSTAEQAFLAWYHRYTVWTLPVEYNLMIGQSLANDGLTTVGGARPIVLHFSGAKKPSGFALDDPVRPFLCSAPELRSRRSAANTARLAPATPTADRDARLSPGAEASSGSGHGPAGLVRPIGLAGPVGRIAARSTAARLSADADVSAMAAAKRRAMDR